mmetsp:Transcript_153752/g.283341  ORF Transcript_153752/g.283341 Transcript_153752/m.283341 type:complete len:102 (-) Transcript_153752:635-940(-)
MPSVPSRVELMRKKTAVHHLADYHHQVEGMPGQLFFRRIIGTITIRYNPYTEAMKVQPPVPINVFPRWLSVNHVFRELVFASAACFQFAGYIHMKCQWHRR